MLCYSFYVMNAKSKIKRYKKVVEKVCIEYKGAHEFIVNKGISTEEVRLYIF